MLEFAENISLDNYLDVSRKHVCLFMVLSGSLVNTISKLKATNLYLQTMNAHLLSMNY